MHNVRRRRTRCRHLEATPRCPVVNESENKLLGPFHHKMQFAPFMEPVLRAERGRETDKVGVRVSERRVETADLALRHDRHLNYICFVADSLSFLALPRASSSEPLEECARCEPTRNRILPR